MKRIRLLTLAFAIGFTANMASALSPSYYTQTSRLSEGHWVKIKVTDNGMHQITYDQLRAWGFSDPEQVVVYGYGGCYLGHAFSLFDPDDLTPVKTIRVNDKLCFYGQTGIVATPTDPTDFVNNLSIKKNQASLRAGYYLLSDSHPSDFVEPEMSGYNPSVASLNTSHNSLLFQKYSATNNGKGGAHWFGPAFVDGEAQHYYFNAIDPENQAVGSFIFRWVAKHSIRPKMMCYTDFSNIVNSEIGTMLSLTTKSTVNYCYATSRYDGVLSDDTPINNNLYDIEFSISGGSPNSYAALDYMALGYTRKNIFHPNNGQMSMYFSDVNNQKGCVIDNIDYNNDTFEAWDVTSPLTPYRFVLQPAPGNDTALSFTFRNNFEEYTNVIAFDPQLSLLPVEFAGNVENQNLHGITQPVNMLIITTKTLRPYAEELAEAHRQYQGLNVVVVEQEQIFNEYSSGTPSTTAYRRFAKMLYDRHTDDFKYLLLYGPASYDNSRILFTSNDNLLTFEAEYEQDARQATTSYASDTYFGKISDSFNDYYTAFTLNELCIGVGRIPAPSTSVAEQVNRKLIKLLKEPQESNAINRAIYLCDDGDANGHLEQAEELADTLLALAPHITPIKVYNDLYPFTNYDAVAARAKITQSLASGVGFFSYTGHGNPSAFNAENIWAKRFTNEANYEYIPFAVLSTCDSFAFDHGDNGMSETFLYKENGGMMGIVGASRTVFKAYNQYLNRAMAIAYCNAGPDDCIGDIFKIGHNKSTYGYHSRELGANTMCYNLCGDPAMPLFGAKYKIALTTINNETVPSSSSTDLLEMYPRATNTVTGKIVDQNGNIVTGFNGKVTLSLYESVDSVDNLRQGGDLPITVATIHDQLTEVAVPVENGQFSANVTFPIALRPNGRNRMTLYAFNGNMKERAVGVEDHIVVMPYDEEKAISDPSLPAITEMYIDNETFREGDLVPSAFTFHAKVQAGDLGVSNASSLIGSAVLLSLDERKSYSDATHALRADSDGSYSMSFPISDIENGSHTLTLEIGDNAGNRVSRKISFIVVDFNVEAELTVAESPVREVATFNATDNLQEPGSYTLVIERRDGSNVFVDNNVTFPYEWDLTDNGGEKVTDGEYNAYVIIRNSKQFGSSEKIKLIVVKKPASEQ